MVKIRTRLFLTFLILVGLGFYGLVDWLLDDLRPRYLETTEEAMVDTATLLSSLLATQVSPDGQVPTGGLRAAFDDAHAREFSARIYELAKTRMAMRVYVTDARGIVLFDSDGGKDEGRDYSRWNDVYKTLRGEYGARSTRRDPNDPGTSTLHVASPIRVGGETVGVLTVCKPSGSVTQFIQRAKRKIVGAAVVAAAAVVLVGIVASAWVTRPIQKLTRYAHAVRDGKRVSLPALGRSEIGELGAAFEQMRDALEGKRYVEEYVQTLTHEMKSPLASLQGAAELLEEDVPPEQRRRFLENIRTETTRIRNVVDRLLQLSSLESRKALREVEPIGMTELVSEVLESMNPLITGKALSLEKKLDADTAVRGERFLIRQAFQNLLQNAIEFTPRGGAVSVGLRRDGEAVVLSVADTGVGIPDYALSQVFDRFYSLRRPDTGRKSSGLGLPFVREAATLHGGEATLENRPDGGAVATLRLPCIHPGN
ncbi:MAG: two-component system sensor histidine kinase CreC [Kiritimatiellae bacterium]|nr:two-component system sensor histidine kinase CreC [Kiritimatiellia bacterium]